MAAPAVMSMAGYDPAGILADLPHAHTLRPIASWFVVALTSLLGGMVLGRV